MKSSIHQILLSFLFGCLALPILSQSKLYEVQYDTISNFNRQFMVENNHPVYGTTRVIAYTTPSVRKNYIYFYREFNDEIIERTFLNEYQLTSSGQLAMRSMTVDDDGLTYCLFNGGGLNQMQVICFDTNGDIAFNTRLTLNNTYLNWFHSLVPYSTGIYAFLSLPSGKFAVYKISNSGALLWGKEFSDTNIDFQASGYVATPNSLDGLVVVASSKIKLYTVNIGSDGEILWEHTNSSDVFVRPTCVFMDSANYIHVFGIYGSTYDNRKPCHLKYNLDGDLMDAEYYTFTVEGLGLDVKKKPNNDGYFLFCNTSYGSVIVFLNASFQPYLVKTYSTELNLLSTILTRLRTDKFSLTFNSDYMGSLNFDLAQVDQNNICPSLLNFIPQTGKEFGLLDSAFHFFNHIESFDSDPPTGFGVNWEEIDRTDLKIVDFCLNTDVLSLPETSNSELRLFPNPCSEKVTLLDVRSDEIKSIKIFDSIGKQIGAGNFYLNDNVIFFRQLESGIYTVVINAKNKVYFKKLLITK